MNQTNNTVLTILVASVVVGAVTGVASAHEGIPDVVKIGGLFDVSGSWAAAGEEAKSVAELAVDDFNEYLAAIGADWTLEMKVEDAQANSEVARTKITDLYGTSGINMILGVGFSQHIVTALSYIDNNNILVISHASQAPNLAIDDTIFRLRPNDVQQAPVVNAMLKDAGIEVLGTVTIGDTWGDGLKDSVSDIFNGTVVELFRYNPDALEFSAEVNFLDDDIKRLIETHGADKVGVLYVGTDEFQLLIEQTRLYENIDKVRWFSTTTQADSVPDLIGNEWMREFYDNTNFTAVQSVPVDTNSITRHVNNWVMENYNQTAGVYSYPSYDSVWLLGTSILQAQTTDIDVLKEVIPLVARHSLGSVGSLELSEEGDLLGGSNEIWQVVDGEWVRIAGYDPTNQSLTP